MMWAKQGGIAAGRGVSVGRWMRRVFGMASALAVFALLSGAPAVNAADAKPKDARAEAAAKKEAAKKQKARGDNFSERNIKKIVKMRELWDAGDNAGAKAILQSINVAREKPYGRSKIYQFLGMFAQQDEDYDKAIDYLNKAVNEGGLEESEKLQTLFQVGMIQMKMERYEDGIATIEKWMETAPAINGQAYYTLAVAYYQAKKAEKALAPAKKALEVSENPPEAWYRLLLALYLEANRYDEGIKLLDTILSKYPKKEYWNQLAALYNSQDQMDKSLAVQQLARYQGMPMDGRDLKRMAQMFMVLGLPHRGAELMKKGLEDGSVPPDKEAYQTYSDTLLQSREWALALDPIAKAAELAQDGSLWVRHAQVNLQLGNWKGARDSLNRAFQKGKISDEGQAHILFGIAAANDKLWNEATASFNRAANFPGTVDVAAKWLGYVEREKMRFATPEEQAKMAAERAQKEAEAAAKAGGAEAATGEKPAGEQKPGDKKPGDKPAGATTQASAAQPSAKN